MGNVPARINDKTAGKKAGPGTRIGLALLRKAPMLFASGVAHLALLLILSQFGLLTTPPPEPANDNIIVDLREINTRNVLGELLAAIREHKQPVAESQPAEQETSTQPAEETDTPAAEADPLDIDLPVLVSQKPKIALGEGHGRPSVANRTAGGKRSAVKTYGGTPQSENAVKAALRWLVRHQDRDGKWSCRNFARNCRSRPRCSGAGSKTGIDSGLTGLVLLAFLSGGHHPADGTDFGNAAGRGIGYLLRAQNDSGRIGPASSHEMYNHSIATLAIAEACILSGDKSLRDPLKRAVDYIIEAQQAEGGWDYTPARTGRNDSSITGFVVMALKSASAARIDVPWMVTYGMIEHFDRMTKQSAEVIYANRGVGAGRAGPGMVAVGALSRQFLGWPLDSQKLAKQYAIMRRNPPRWELLTEDAYHNMYYWYYGTLAMFQAGGENWAFWNANLRDMLIRHQRKKGCARGSWDPADKWLGKAAGRVYATAINAMNLQVYYRYLPVYEAPSLNSVEALVRASSARGEMRMRALRILGEFRSRQSRETLVRSLGDEDPFIRLNAAVSLIEHGNTKRSLRVLFHLSRDENGFVRARAVEEMVKLHTPALIPVLIERLNDEQDFVAARAAEKLRRLCRKNFNFDSSAGEEEKDMAVAGWREWYTKYKAGEVQIDKSQILGSVINVKPTLVMLDVGRGDSVSAGDDFDVIRGGKVIARVKIFRVLKQFSAARIMPGDTGGVVREGDIVKKTKPKT